MRLNCNDLTSTKPLGPGQKEKALFAAILEKWVKFQVIAKFGQNLTWNKPLNSPRIKTPTANISKAFESTLQIKHWPLM